jgi:hypothetical protein
MIDALRLDEDLYRFFMKNEWVDLGIPAKYAVSLQKAVRDGT